MLLVVKRNDCDNQNQNEIVCYHSRRIHPSPPCSNEMEDKWRHTVAIFRNVFPLVLPQFRRLIQQIKHMHSFDTWEFGLWMDGWMNKWVASAVEIGNVMFQVSHSTTDQMTDGTMVVDFFPRFFWCFIFFAFPFPGEDENAENFSLFSSFCFFPNGFS